MSFPGQSPAMHVDDVIGIACTAFNATSCVQRSIWALIGSIYRSRRRQTPKRTEWLSFSARTGSVRLTFAARPVRIELREHCVAVNFGLNLGDVELIGDIKTLPVNLAATNHRDLPGPCLRGDVAGSFKRSLKRPKHLDTFGLKTLNVKSRCWRGRAAVGRSTGRFFRPMITGAPSVTALKCLRSDGSRQGMSPSRPMTPFSARATTIWIFGP
jgi:hypothetical protein